MHRGIKSNLLLPVARIAAAAKTGNDQEGIGFDEKKERVGKFLRLRAPHCEFDELSATSNYPKKPRCGAGMRNRRSSGI